jgi:UDP:flavonoid glycosyltransferase YjiC (YdhE family)
MRVLCTCWPALGRFHVMVPLARGLASAGHEVAFATAAAVGPHVRQVGFEVFPAGPSEAEAITAFGRPTAFQFRAVSALPLEVVMTTMPPWPGPSEAVPAEGVWPASFA